MNTDNVRFREYPVHAALVPFVKCIWSLESDQPVHPAPRERILPDGCVELVFHFKDPFRTHFANESAALQPRSFIVGQMSRFLEIEPTGRIGLFAIRFHARGAYLFLSCPLSEVTNQDVGLEHVFGARANEWSERVALAPTMTARVQFVEMMLIRLLRTSGRLDRTVDRCLHLIESVEGQLSVAQLAPRLGVSSRHLSRKFQDAVGMSPKEFARVNRFTRVVKCLHARSYPTLTAAAHACGYFDQAHLNHEFREFAGMTPGGFLTSPDVAF